MLSTFLGPDEKYKEKHLHHNIYFNLKRPFEIATIARLTKLYGHKYKERLWKKWERLWNKVERHRSRGKHIEYRRVGLHEDNPY